MKTIFKRASKSTLAVVLAVCLLFSCMTVGVIATDAAKVNEEVVGDGDTTYYLHIGETHNFTKAENSFAFTYDSVNSLYYASYELTANKEYPMVICTTSGALGDGQKSSSNQSVTSLAAQYNPDSIQFNYFEYKSNNYDGYDCFKLGTKTTQTVYFTFTSTSSGLVVRSSLPGGGGESGGDDPTPSGGTTTDTANAASTKTLLVAYHSASKWTHSHIWYNDNNTNIVDGTQSTGEMTTVSGYTGLRYKNITSSVTRADKQINFLVKNGTRWNDFQSADVKESGFVKGKQWCYYTTTNENTSGTSAEYTPLTITTIEHSTTITEDIANSFTVNVEGGLPWFYKEKLSTDKNYTLSVGTSSGGTQVLNAQTFNYTDKKKTFNWTPSSSGSVTLYYTLTDGIDTVTYSKEYTVIPRACSSVSLAKTSPASGTIYENETAVTYTATAASPESGVTYNFKVDGTTVQNTSSNTYTITFTSAGTKSVTVTVEKSGYGSVTSTAVSTTVSSRPAYYLLGLKNDYNWDIDDANMMTYNPSTSLYEITRYLYSGSTTYGGTDQANATDTGFKVYNDSTYYGSTDGYTINGMTYNNTALASGDDKKNVCLTTKDLSSVTSEKVPYKFTYSTSTNIVTVYYPMKVTYNMQSHGTNPSANGYVVAYGSTITAPTAPTEAGYTFGGWYKEAACTNAWDFSTDTVTVDTVLYAKWTENASHTITVNSSNSKLGTATASAATASEGQTITITATESTGTFTGWTVNSGSVTLADSSAKSTTFTLGSANVSITANFSEYTPTDSDYYYNGYKLSNGNASPYSDFYSKRMTTAKIGGQVYSYYKVDGRSDTEQLLTVSKKSPKYNSYNTYFEIWSSWESGGVKAQFYASDGNNLGDYANMTYDSEANEKKKFKIAIPDGAKSVQFKHGSNTTGVLSLTDGNNAWYTNNKSGGLSDLTGYNSSNPVPVNFYEYFNAAADYTADFNTIGFYDHNAKRGETHKFSKPKDNTNPYYIVVLEPNTEYTFNDVTKTTGSKPMVLCMTELPGTASSADTVKIYAKDGAIRRDGDLPERNNRTYSYFEQHANTFVYSDSACTQSIGTRSSFDGQSSEGTTGYNGYTYDYVAEFVKGQTFYLKTNMDSTLLENHYLVAYSINGKCYKLHAASESVGGSVTEAFTVPEDWEDKYVEITPIYFPKDADNCITFYVEGYDEEVMNAGWGNTPYVYPFYQDDNYNYVGNINNAFGGYPGQPLVFYRGNYYTMIPKEYDTFPESGGSKIHCSIRGITLGNGYWDDVHFHIGEVTSHFQTYDYDDLYKIYKEYPEHADNIICSFKYRTKKNNDEPSSLPTGDVDNYDKTNGNGWEVLTDYYGRPVDIFGNILIGNENVADADQTIASNLINGTLDPNTATGVVHAISQDYKSNSAGEYGTEWAIYNTAGTKVKTTGTGAKSTIVPAALAIKEASNFTNYDVATRAFEGIYTALKNDSNVLYKPVVITYEKSIYGGSDKADRCDARWYYSKKGESITAKTMIEYTDDGKTWRTDAYGTGENAGTGSVTSTKAYFTGTATTATDTPSTPTGNTTTTTLGGTTGDGNYYTFNAENAGQYQFVGWYLLRDNYQNISVRSSYGADASQFASHAEQSKNGDIFVARFKLTATGTFDIHHELHPQTTGYGNTYVKAVVLDSSGDEIAESKVGYDSNETSVRIGNTYIQSNSGYKVKATFTASAYNTSTFENFFATQQSLLNGFSGYAYIDSINIENNVATVVYDVDKLFSNVGGNSKQTVTSVTHYSKFALKSDLTYNLQYTFNTRYYGTKLYKYTNANFTTNELKSYFRSQIENPETTTIELDKQFVQIKAPFESNFRENLTWVVDNVEIRQNVGYLTATQVPIDWANALVYDLDNNGEVKTKKMAAPMEKLFDKTVDSKPESQETADSKASAWDTTCTDDKLYTPIRTTYTDGTGTHPLYLDHWEAYQLDSFTYDTTQLASDGINLKIDTGKSTLVCKSYSSKFNYIGYEDYAIVPIYSKTPVNRQYESDNRTDSSATLLTISRNHWNANDPENNPDNEGGKYSGGADRLYVDFMLNYNYSKNGQNIMLSTTGENIKVGFIVKSYIMDYSTGEGLKNYEGRSSKVVMVDKEKIDNKNRIEYCYGFANTETNSQYGLNFEFIPFIVDTTDGVTGAGTYDITIDGTTYKTLYADSTVSILDGVNFYMIGKADTAWAEN